MRSSGLLGKNKLCDYAERMVYQEILVQSKAKDSFRVCFHSLPPKFSSMCVVNRKGVIKLI